MKNYADLGGCYPPQPSASADNTLLDLHNSSYHTQPHPIIAKYNCCFVFYFFVARRFMAGAQMLRQLYFGALDMELHTRYLK